MSSSARHILGVKFPSDHKKIDLPLQIVSCQWSDSGRDRDKFPSHSVDPGYTRKDICACVKVLFCFFFKVFNSKPWRSFTQWLQQSWGQHQAEHAAPAGRDAPRPHQTLPPGVSQRWSLPRRPPFCLVRNIFINCFVCQHLIHCLR